MTEVIRTGLRGPALLHDATLNKGTAFTEEERVTLGIDGLLPARVETLEEQLVRVDDAFRRFDTDLARHIFLRALQDSSEILFQRYVIENLEEMLPIIYTPTVGVACQEFSHIYRRPRGLFLRSESLDRLDAELDAAPDDVEVIVVTDGERILGLGDQGVGGMGIPIGKLSLYSAVGGIDPRRTLPILLDVGTDNEGLLADPLYLGTRHRRITDGDYNDFVDRVVDAVNRRYPGVLLQWEDFAQRHATDLLERHRERILSFNDDIQGTAAVALAAARTGLAITGKDLADATVVIAGAGSAGSGIARMLRRSGLRAENLYMTDVGGLLHDRRDDLVDFQLPLRQPWERVASWADPNRATDLATVVDNVTADVLIGVSGQGGIFTEPIIRSMRSRCARPVVLPLSNPTALAEATPADVLEWSMGRALVATGSPFDPVPVDGVPRHISQSNNIYIFPGLGLGALAAEARMVTDGMLSAAAEALAEHHSGVDDGSLLPPLSAAREVSVAIAEAVAVAAVAEGVAPYRDGEEIAARVAARRWTPAYPHIVAG